MAVGIDFMLREIYDDWVSSLPLPVDQITVAIKERIFRRAAGAKNHRSEQRSRLGLPQEVLLGSVFEHSLQYLILSGKILCLKAELSENLALHGRLA